MSPARTRVRTTARGFPRVSGDEPGPLRGWLPETMFSPRERG